MLLCVKHCSAAGSDQCLAQSLPQCLSPDRSSAAGDSLQPQETLLCVGAALIPCKQVLTSLHQLEVPSCQAGCQSPGKMSPHFINLDEVAQSAKAGMTKMAYDYYASGAETETSVQDNRQAFATYRILPRILVDVSNVDTTTHMFGT